MMSIAEAIAFADRECQAGNLPKAEFLYRVVLSDLHNRLGIVCGQQRKLQDAADSLREAVRLRPDLAAPYSNLGNVLRLQGKLDDAVAQYQQALRLEPRLADAHNNLGLTLMRLGLLDEALGCFRSALAINPHYQTAQSNLLLCLNYLPRIDPEAVFAEHVRWGKAHAAPMAPSETDRNPDRRLRVGYVSPDFSGHVVAHFLLPILENHDPKEVEVHCYAQVYDPDAVTTRFQSLAAVWRPITAMDDARAAEQIRADRIDILVDLAGHTADNRLGIFARKPAPVQASYLGYPNTTGLPTVDYRITDAVADPLGGEVRSTEELVRLPGPFCCYQASVETPPVAPPPARRSGRVTFGSTNDLAKLNPDVLELWCEVLKAVPSGQLLIVRHTLSESRKEALRRHFGARGIDDARVLFRTELPAGRSHLSVYDDIDILLDVFPWNGHVTTCQAVWMGVPVISVRGHTHAGRLSASVLSRVGLEDWIASNFEHYVEEAVRRAADLDFLARLRSELRPRMQASSLCDGRSFTRNLEAAYRTMWRRWCDARA
jgi:predicted O-linked N-acetylglucosamine transferase (SPINDLY family)